MKQKENSEILPDWKLISKVQKFKKEDLNKILNKYIENKNSIYKEIKSIKKEDRNFENTILALEYCDIDFDDIIHQISILSESHNKKEVRDLFNEFKINLTDKSVDIEFDKEIYTAVLDYKEGNFRKEKNILDGKFGIGSTKLVEDFYKVYKRMGFDLSKKDFIKFKANLKKISKLSISFSENINNHNDFVLCTKEEIIGLPENEISLLEKVKDEYKVSIQDHQFIPFIRFVESREKRKELYDKRQNRGGIKNIKILKNIIEIRHQNAKMLSYKNHVDFVAENRMAKNEKNIRGFLENTIKKIDKNSKKELKELLAFANGNIKEYKDVKKLEYFDSSFVANKLKESIYFYDSSKVKEYFELDHVIKEMFDIFGSLFNFSVKEVEEKEKKEKGIVFFDKNLKLFELKDKNKIVSYLILDLFNRDGKHNGACSAEFVDGGSLFVEGEWKRKIPVNYILCNFSKGNKKIPSLLTIRDVETLFHEFGHSLHYMLTEAKHISQAGYDTVWDFVETPSQFMENFFYEEKYLKQISKHYITGKSLDKDVMNKIISSRDFLAGYNYLVVFIMSLFDLNIHSDINIKNIDKYYNDLMKKYFDFDNNNIFPAGFHHLVGGYDAGYYSYMWALVYAKDFYSEFKKVMNDKNKLKEIGERYRKEILEVGGSRQEAESVKKFLKRSSNSKAFLKEIGVK